MNQKVDSYLQNIFKTKNYNHLFLHGPPGSGKKTLIYKALGVTRLTEYSYEKINYKKWSRHYFFHSMDINKNKKHFVELIKDILDTNIEQDNGTQNIVILSSDHLQEFILNFLRRFLETSTETSRFIFINTSCRGPIQAIRSRCLFIRVPYPSKDTYRIFIKKECKKQGITYKEEYLETRNMNVLMDKLLLENIGAEYIDNIENFCIYVKENINDYLKIQLALRNIIKEGHLCQDIIKRLSLYFNDSESIKIIADHDHKMCLGYRELIHMESLLYSLHLSSND